MRASAPFPISSGRTGSDAQGHRFSKSSSAAKKGWATLFRDNLDVVRKVASKKTTKYPIVSPPAGSALCGLRHERRGLMAGQAQSSRAMAMPQQYPLDREEKKAALLSNVERIREVVLRHSVEAETQATLPAPSSSGLWTLKLPAALGGAEADPDLRRGRHRNTGAGRLQHWPFSWIPDHSSSGLTLRRRLVVLRLTFASMRRSFEARVGRVAMRGRGANVARRTSSARWSRASSRQPGSRRPVRPLSFF